MKSGDQIALHDPKKLQLYLSLLTLKQYSFGLHRKKKCSKFDGIVCIRFLWVTVTLSPLIKSWEGIIHEKSCGWK